MNPGAKEIYARSSTESATNKKEYQTTKLSLYLL